jgi:hypothetical protein
LLSQPATQRLIPIARVFIRSALHERGR